MLKKPLQCEPQSVEITRAMCTLNACTYFYWYGRLVNWPYQPINFDTELRMYYNVIFGDKNSGSNSDSDLWITLQRNASNSEHFCQLIIEGHLNFECILVCACK